MKCTLHIYIVPSVDWYHHWRNRSSSFGGEANTNYYPSAKIICDERTEGRTDGHADYYMAALREIFSIYFKNILILLNYMPHKYITINFKDILFSNFSLLRRMGLQHLYIVLFFTKCLLYHTCNITFSVTLKVHATKWQSHSNPC